MSPRSNLTPQRAKNTVNDLSVVSIWVRFFKKIQDWILKSERIRKWILRFFTKQINPRSFGPWCVKGTEESTSRVDSSVPLTHHDPRYLGLICLLNTRRDILYLHSPVCYPLLISGTYFWVFKNHIFEYSALIRDRV